MRPSLADLQRPSVVALLAANLVPLVGVLALGWDLGAVMLLFWAENAVIGGYHLLKIGLILRRWPVVAVLAAGFFAFHYGMFTFVHGLFVVGLFVLGPEGDYAAGARAALVVVPGLVALVASHGLSFWRNFYKGGELARMRAALDALQWTKTGKDQWKADVDDAAVKEGTETYEGFLGLGDLMTAPYRRVVVMHLTIIGTAFLMAFLGTPRLGIALLVVLKTGVDVRTHLNERRRARGESRAKWGFF